MYILHCGQLTMYAPSSVSAALQSGNIGMGTSTPVLQFSEQAPPITRNNIVLIPSLAPFNKVDILIATWYSISTRDEVSYVSTNDLYTSGLRVGTCMWCAVNNLYHLPMSLSQSPSLSPSLPLSSLLLPLPSSPLAQTHQYYSQHSVQV